MDESDRSTTLSQFKSCWISGLISIHRRTGRFFLGGLGHLCPKNFSAAPEKIFGSARKKCYANLQNNFARLTPHSNC